VDQSARIQTVDADRNPIYRRLLEAFERRTGCPVLVNTSYNLSWEPIVCTPAQAYRTFMASNLDLLCIGPYVLAKTAQPAWVDGTSNRAATGQALRALLDRGWHDRLAHALDTSLPYNSPVVVVGEGVADLVHLLGVACRRVLGIETNAALLDKATQFAHDNDLNRVQFVHASVNQLPLEPGGCDALVVLERQPVEAEVLAHLVTRLRPGGYLFILQSDANVRGLVRRLQDYDVSIVRGVPPLVSEPDDAEPGSLCESRPTPTQLDLVIATLRRQLGGVPKGTLLGDLRFLVVAERRSARSQ
jgi:carbamoyltransferase